jgi:hypothetical protein
LEWAGAPGQLHAAGGQGQGLLLAVVIASLSITRPFPRARAARAPSICRYHDTMLDHDRLVGDILKTLDDLGVADNTLVQ